MTNTEILRTPDARLTAIEKQKKFCLNMAAQRCPCPVCNMLASKFEAAKITVDEYTFGSTKLAYACPGCGVALREVVPLFSPSPGRHWFWWRKFDEAPA